MLNSKNHWIFGLFFSLLNSANSQNLNFRLPHVNNQTINPALIGLGHFDEYQATRIHSGIKAQWIGINKRLSTSSLSVDFAGSGNSSFGVALINTDFMSTRENQTTRYNHLGGQLSYAYLLKTNKINWKFGLSVQTSNYQFGSANFIWADQVNSELTAFTNPTQEPVQNQSIYSVQVAAGALAIGKNWFAGLAVHNINEPNIAFFSNVEQPLYRKIVFHGGLKLKKDFSSTYFIPTLQITNQFLTTTYAFDAVFQNGNVFYGLGNFTSAMNQQYVHALHTFLTVRKNAWAIGYDLDLNLTANSAGPLLTHEFNLIYLLKSKSNKRAVSQMLPIL